MQQTLAYAFTGASRARTRVEIQGPPGVSGNRFFSPPGGGDEVEQLQWSKLQQDLASA